MTAAASVEKRVDTLRRAADRARTLAEAALGERPEWFTEVDGHNERTIWAQRDAWDYAPTPVLSEHDLRKTPGTFEHFAAMTPAVALSVADLFEEFARLDDQGIHPPTAVVTLAKRYLGEAS